MLFFEFLRHFAVTSQWNLKKFLDITVVLPTRNVTQKLCFSAGFYINLCTIHFYDLFAKYRNSTNHNAPGNKALEDLQSITVTLIGPRTRPGFLVWSNKLHSYSKQFSRIPLLLELLLFHHMHRILFMLFQGWSETYCHSCGLKAPHYFYLWSSFSWSFVGILQKNRRNELCIDWCKIPAT